MIFAFDPQREAIILVAGDKVGRWQAWRRVAMPLADARFGEHLTELRVSGDEHELAGREGQGARDRP